MITNPREDTPQETTPQGLLEADDLRRHIKVQTIGRRIETHRTVSSTNTLALERAPDVSNHGLVIFAESQTAGRGRLNRSWHSPRGASILCTTLLFLDPESPTAKTILLWTTLAVREAILESSNVVTVIKWPNDLVVGNKKLCGVLIESKPMETHRRAYAIGMGINCLQHARHFPPELADSATSLDLESQLPIGRRGVAAALLCSLDHWYTKCATMEPNELKAEWLSHTLALGKRLQLTCENRTFSGSLIELDPQAGILVQLDEGGRRLFSPWSTTIEKTG